MRMTIRFTITTMLALFVLLTQGCAHTLKPTLPTPKALSAIITLQYPTLTLTLVCEVDDTKETFLFKNCELVQPHSNSEGNL